MARHINKAPVIEMLSIGKIRDVSVPCQFYLLQTRKDTCEKKFILMQRWPRCKRGQGRTGKDGILTPLIKQLTKVARRAEVAAHLKDDEPANSQPQERFWPQNYQIQLRRF